MREMQRTSHLRPFLISSAFVHEKPRESFAFRNHLISLRKTEAQEDRRKEAEDKPSKSQLAVPSALHFRQRESFGDFTSTVASTVHAPSPPWPPTNPTLTRCNMTQDKPTQ